MQSVTFAFLGPEAEAAKYGKRGTASDVTLYNNKKGSAHLNLVTATRYPERIGSLLCALDLADEVVLQPSQLDRSLGETVVGCELFGRTRGFLRCGPGVDADQLRFLLSRTALKGLEFSADPEGVLREKLFESAAESTEGPTLVPVDHSFPVKGVGTVVLGLVRSGEVAAHQALQAYPGAKTLDVRSVQVHDIDVKSAPTRSRVGLALKGVESEELPRGTLLAPPGSLSVVAAGALVRLVMRPSSFAKWTPRAGSVVHLIHVLQDVVLRIDAVEPGGNDAALVSGRLDAPLARVPSQPVVAVDFDNKVQRFVGRVDFSP